MHNLQPGGSDSLDPDQVVTHTHCASGQTAALRMRARMRLRVSGVTPKYEARWRNGTRVTSGEFRSINRR